MKRKSYQVIAGVLLFMLAGGCAGLTTRAQREKTYGTEPPVILDSFASKELRPGDTWKIYIKASDPGGDMHRIAATIHQPGMGTYSVSFTRIPEGKGKELYGYLYLNTLTSFGTGWLNFLTLTVTLAIQDRVGHFSEPVTFSLSFQDRYVQEPAPAGRFKEESLGPILVTLRPPDNDGQNGDGFF